MTNNLDVFINFETVKGTIRLGDDSTIESCGRGTVRILAKISHGHVSPVYLKRDLWIPGLGSCSLLSWRSIVSLGKGFCLVSSGSDIHVLGKIKLRLSGESLTDMIMLYKKRRSQPSGLLTNCGTKPLDIHHLIISKAPTTPTLSTSPKTQRLAMRNLHYTQKHKAKACINNRDTLRYTVGINSLLPYRKIF